MLSSYLWIRALLIKEKDNRSSCFYSSIMKSNQWRIRRDIGFSVVVIFRPTVRYHWQFVHFQMSPVSHHPSNRFQSIQLHHQHSQGSQFNHLTHWKCSDSEQRSILVRIGWTMSYCKKSSQQQGLAGKSHGFYADITWD